MAVNRKEPEIFIEGIDEVLKLDLGKHKELLARAQNELVVFREAVSHEVKKKRYYFRQIGQGKFNDEALKTSVDGIKVNIRHLSDKVKTTENKIEHEKLIVDTLIGQLEEYDKAYANFNKHIH